MTRKLVAGVVLSFFDNVIFIFLCLKMLISKMFSLFSSKIRRVPSFQSRVLTWSRLYDVYLPNVCAVCLCLAFLYLICLMSPK